MRTLTKDYSKFSKAFRNDPTRSLKRIKRFQTEMAKLIENTINRCIDRLKNPHLVHTVNLSHLQSNINYQSTLKEFDQAIEEEFIAPSKRLVEIEIPEAYTSGGTFGKIALGGTLEQRQKDWEKIKVMIEKTNGSFQGCADDLSKRMREIVGAGIVSEKSLSDIARDLYKVSDVGISSCERIVKTEIMISVNAGVTDRYKESGCEKVQWLTVLDDHQCDECEDLDENVFPIDAHPDCPLHPNCRCTLLPVFTIPGESPEGETEGEKGEVLSDTEIEKVLSGYLEEEPVAVILPNPYTKQGVKIR